MNSKSLILGMALLLIMGSTGILFAHAEDLSGTWTGTTMINGMEETLKLVLNKKGDTYTGTVTDSAGYSNDTEIESVEIDNDQLRFTFDISSGTEYMTITVILTVSGNEMTGEWMSDDGGSGPIELKKE